ncbi:MAG: hypothetical protein HY319_08175 [Armatimonadetes bacterium]|nr:hypothetical protein [Armatimonadota bacterium]
MDAEEVQRRAAKINTNLRFGKTREALTEAYKFRMAIHTSGAEDPRVERELELVEHAINRLENQRFGLHRELAQTALKALYDLILGRSSREKRR